MWPALVFVIALALLVVIALVGTLRHGIVGKIEPISGIDPQHVPKSVVLTKDQTAIALHLAPRGELTLDALTKLVDTDTERVTSGEAMLTVATQQSSSALNDALRINGSVVQIWVDGSLEQLRAKLHYMLGCDAIILGDLDGYIHCNASLMNTWPEGRMEISALTQLGLCSVAEAINRTMNVPLVVVGSLSEGCPDKLQPHEAWFVPAGQLKRTVTANTAPLVAICAVLSLVAYERTVMVVQCI